MTRPTDVGSRSGGSGEEESSRAEPPHPPRELLHLANGEVEFAADFDERLQRNVEILSHLGKPFALYWIKSRERSSALNEKLQRLCRQEDIICLNAAGEFVALLTGTTAEGVHGFEGRLDDQLGGEIAGSRVARGFRLFGPDDTAQKRRTQPPANEPHLDVSRR